MKNCRISRFRPCGLLVLTSFLVISTHGQSIADCIFGGDTPQNAGCVAAPGTVRILFEVSFSDIDCGGFSVVEGGRYALTVKSITPANSVFYTNRGNSNVPVDPRFTVYDSNFAQIGFNDDHGRGNCSPVFVTGLAPTDSCLAVSLKPGRYYVCAVADARPTNGGLAFVVLDVIKRATRVPRLQPTQRPTLTPSDQPSSKPTPYPTAPPTSCYTNFYLVNVETSADIRKLTCSENLDLSLYSGISIRYEPQVGSPAGIHVVFKVDNKVVADENSVPYAIMGGRQGAFIPWIPVLGKRVIRADVLPINSKRTTPPLATERVTIVVSQSGGP